MKRKHLLSDSVICARSSWLAHLFTRRESSRQDGELTKEDHGAQFTKKKTNHTSEIWVPTVTAKVLNPHLHPSVAGIVHLDEAFGHFERAVGLWPTLGPPDLQQGVVNALWRYPGRRNSINVLSDDGRPLRFLAHPSFFTWQGSQLPSFLPYWRSVMKTARKDGHSRSSIEAPPTVSYSGPATVRSKC